MREIIIKNAFKCPPPSTHIHFYEYKLYYTLTTQNTHTNKLDQWKMF